MKRTIVLALPILVGCVSAPEIGAPFLGANSVSPFLKQSSATARRAYNDALISDETYRYISGALTWKKAPNRGCSAPVEREINEYERRRIAFNLLQDYFKNVVDNYNSPSPLENTSAAILQAADGLNSLTFLPVDKAQMAALKGLVNAAAGVWKQIDLAKRRFFIQREARDKQKNVEMVVNDLIQGLVSLNVEIATNIKIFEECEYEKLIYIRDNDQNSKISLEERYSSFLRQKIAYKGFSIAEKDIKKLLNKITEAHKSIFMPNLKSIDDVMRELNDAISALNGFKSAVEQYDLKRDEFIKTLRTSN